MCPSGDISRDNWALLSLGDEEDHFQNAAHLAFTPAEELTKPTQACFLHLMSRVNLGRFLTALG